MSASTICKKAFTGLYRHYKNKQVYRVLDIVLHTETQQHMVLYKELIQSEQNPNNLRFVRPFEMFTELVEYNGKMVPRFEKVSKEN